MRKYGALFMFLLGAAPAWTGDRAEDVPVFLRERDGRVYDLEGRFTVRVPKPVAWAVLTDYGRIRDFVPSVRASRAVERRRGLVVVEQSMSGKVFLFSREVSLRLEVREEGLERISFRDVLGSDFESYEGSWILEETPEGVQVLYRLSARPNFRVPAFMARSAFKKSVRQLLESVRTEMLRRGR
jgi:hypothetical protein